MSSSHTNAAAAPPVFRSFLFSPPRGVQRQRHPTTTAKRHSIRKHLEAVFGTRIVVGAQFNGYIPAMSTLDCGRQRRTTTVVKSSHRAQTQRPNKYGTYSILVLVPWDGMGHKSSSTI